MKGIVADVNIQGGNLLVVTGKAFGITNIIALDAQRNVIQDQRVLVERDDQGKHAAALALTADLASLARGLSNDIALRYFSIVGDLWQTIAR